MFKFWQNMKTSTKVTFVLLILFFALVIGWFSDFIPNLVLNHYRSQYAELPKDKDTGFPSLKDRTESNGMAVFIDMAFWYDMAQMHSKARDCYIEALYRYGWDHPRAPEVLVDIMEDTFHGSNADSTESNAVLFYWLFAVKYNEKYAGRNDTGLVTNPGFAAHEPEVQRMIRQREGRVLLPTPDSDYELSNPHLVGLKDHAAFMFLQQFMAINKEMKINKPDLDAVGDSLPLDYLPSSGTISEFSIKDWQ